MSNSGVLRCERLSYPVRRHDGFDSPYVICRVERAITKDSTIEGYIWLAYLTTCMIKLTSHQVKLRMKCNIMRLKVMLYSH